MEYQYEITDKDSFYFNFNARYFQYRGIVVAVNMNDAPRRIIINTFDIESKSFTKNEDLTRVGRKNLKNIDFIDGRFGFAVIIDMTNKSYAISCSFPYLISEIDGNCITSCRTKEKCYIFHSHTMNYGTGVFIYDIENDTINRNDFMVNEKYRNDEDGAAGAASEVYESEYTNVFTALHCKDIDNCAIYEDNIIIDINDKLCVYDFANNILTEVFQTEYKGEMKVCNNYLLVKNRHGKVYIYDITSQNLIKSIDACDTTGQYWEYCHHWDVCGGKLILVTRQNDVKRIKIINLKLQ